MLTKEKLRSCFAVALLATSLTACGIKTGGAVPGGPAGESAKLIGIWKMSPLAGGIANVVEFTSDGESRLYPYNCITRDREAPEAGRYAVDPSRRTIRIAEDGGSQTLKIIFVSDAFLLLTQDVGGENLTFQYEKGSDLVPLCGPDDRWEKERRKRVPYASSDFVPNPTIPPHPDMERYVGRWANEKGQVQIEVQRVSDGSYQLKLANDNWTYLYNSVHWKDDELHFTSFAYANRSDLFGHPFHKSSNKGFLVPLPDGRSIKFAFFIGGKKYDFVYFRK
ncbi:hypothetical protein CupriaWKF_12550 [Cupriavidus sp. WKF15]|uniref:hypothetical protein n=1 Tax=Cupriavidus sp. WKF15 TaxID=3032282 RepID=UPI0023E15F08|nr:hypothetical protein [Cupriavidus sp. WKF15]WER45137.1 hypothetical protein CupriaWKF_12550 [Cupriavidus sp. WKF15]